jgi:hypothetical protein
MLLVLLPILLVAAYAAVIAIHACKRPEQGRNPFAPIYEALCHLNDRTISHLRGVGVEIYKGLVVERGGVYLVALAIVVCQLFPVVGGWASQGRTLRERRLDEWEGVSRSDTVAAAMAQEKAELDEAFADYAQKQADYAAGIIDADQMQIADMLIMSYETRQDVYDSLEQKIERQEAKGREAWLFNDRWLQELFFDQSTQRQLGLVALLGLVLLITPLFAYETQSGARPILRLTGRGRKKFVLRKQEVLLLAVLLVSIIVYGGHFWSVVRYYGIHGLNAPIQASDKLENSTWELTVGQFLMLVYGLRVLTLWCVAELLLLLSVYTQKTQTAALLGIMLFVLPAALVLMGLDIVQWISSLKELSAVELLQSVRYSGVQAFLPYAVCFVLALASLFLSARKWNHTVK